MKNLKQSGKYNLQQRGYGHAVCLTLGAFTLTTGTLLSSAIAEELSPTQRLRDVVVTATTIEDRFEKSEEPSSTAFISGEEVDAAKVQNIQQVLQRIPGLTTEVQSGDSLKIHIRGVENQVFMGEKPGVAVVIDGVPVFERTGRVNIDLDNIESIRVIKGGASYLFGDDALSGAVIITTKRGAARNNARITAETGSYGYRKWLAHLGLGGERANAHIQVSKRETDGYHHDSASSADYVNGKLQYYLSDYSDLTFGFELGEREKNSHGTVRGVTAAKNDPRSYDPNYEYKDFASRYDVKLDKYYLTYTRDIGANSNLMVNGYYFGDHTKYKSSPVRFTENYNYFNDYQQAQRGIKSEYRTGGERSAWMLGVDLRDNRYENQTTVIDNTGLWGAPAVGSLSSDNDTQEQVYAAYGEYKWNVTDPLTLTVNGRIDRIELDYSDKLDATRSGTKSFNIFSWRLGGNYTLRDNVTLYSNLSTGFRAPTVHQLFVGNNSPQHRVLANPKLKPEHSLNIEFGTRVSTLWGGIPVNIDLSVFQLDRKDHIRATAGQYTTSDDNIYDNIGNMRHRGLELALSSDPHQQWSWELAYTWLDAYYTRYNEYHLRTCANVVAGRCTVWDSTPVDNKGNKIPRVPNHRLNLIVNYRPTTAWLISAEMSAISSYYADETNLIKVSGHESYNLLATYSPRLGKQEWSFFARVDNVFNKQYYNTARASADSNYDGVFDAEDMSIVVNPGRVWRAGVEARF